MENLKKEKFDIRKELFVSMINKLNDTQIRHIATLLEVNPQACLEYLHHYKEELNKISKANPIDERDRDWWDQYSDKYRKVIQHDVTTGFCRVVNTTNPSFPSLSFEELLGIVNMEKLSLEERNKIRPKLITLLAQYLYKPINEELSNSTSKANKYWSYHNTVSLIYESLTRKMMMQVKGGCYETKTQQEVLIPKNKVLSPVYFDAEKSILYAYILDTTANHRDADELDIHPIFINSIYEAKLVSKTKLIEPNDITDIRRIKHAGANQKGLFVDIFGDIVLFDSADNATKYHEIVMHLNHVAKAKLLSKSTRFSSYIKLNNEESETIFPFTLKIKLIRLDQLADFIFTNSQHIILDVSASVKKELKSRIDAKIQKYQSIL